MLVLFVAPVRSEVNLTKLTESYIEAAFPTDDGRLRKFKNSSRIEYSIHCFSGNEQKCTDSRAYLQAAMFENPNMRLEEGGAGDVRFALAGKNGLTYLRAKISELFLDGIVDVEDLDCQLYMSLRGDHIVAAVIVVSHDSSPEKFTKCLLVNFYRILGLSQLGGAPFSETWAQRSKSEEELILEKLTLDELKVLPSFKLMQNAFKVLEYIHSFHEIVAGMTKSEVVALLSKDSVCLRDLKGG
jgi:hypothetical protein